jgi:transposase
MWVPPEEKDPVVLQAPTRKSIALFGAVNIRSGRLITMLTDPFDSTSFEWFLRLLLRHRRRRRRTVLILDNAAYHYGENLEELLGGYRGRVGLDYLPPYSPDLNPIERVWKLLKRLCTHNQYFETLDELLEAVTGKLIQWYEPNATLARLCGIN